MSEAAQDWGAVVGELERLLKLKTIVFAMKLFENRADMEAIERIRRPGAVHTMDQIVGQEAKRSDALRSPSVYSSATRS